PFRGPHPRSFVLRALPDGCAGVWPAVERAGLELRSKAGWKPAHPSDGVRKTSGKLQSADAWLRNVTARRSDGFGTPLRGVQHAGAWPAVAVSRPASTFVRLTGSARWVRGRLARRGARRARAPFKGGLEARAPIGRSPQD